MRYPEIHIKMVAIKSILEQSLNRSIANDREEMEEHISGILGWKGGSPNIYTKYLK